MFGRDHRQQQVTRLEREAQQLIAARRPHEAVALQQQAIELVREVVGEQASPTPADLRMLGALQYGLGTSLVSVDEPLAALRALDEAEECYRTLHDIGDAGMQQLIADVKLRRARVLHFVGHVTSAILESGAALHLMTPPDAGDAAMLQYDLDRARVLAGNATVLSDYGDPDLASESADAATRLLLFRGPQINALGDADAYVDILRDAATLAQTLHAGQGRAEVALAAGSVAVDTSDTSAVSNAARVGDSALLPDYRRRQIARVAMQHGLLLTSVDRRAEGAVHIAFAREIDRSAADDVEVSWPEIVTGPVSLATALHTARQFLGEAQVPDDLMRLAPSTGRPGSPLTPTERCAPDQRDLTARRLADVSNSLPRWSLEALRVGFEANCLYAASSDDALDPAAWHRDNARPWGLMLYALINACKEQGDAKLGAEFNTWYGIAAYRVNPFHDPNHGYA